MPLAEPSFARRRLAPALLILSLVLAFNDAAVFRPDLLVECVARIGMIALAAILLWARPTQTRYARARTLLLWGLIGFSFDLFWQDAYGDTFAWIAMPLKYAGVAGGIACFIALTGPPRAAKLAIFTGLVLFAAGTAHGTLWMLHCGASRGGPCYVADAASLSTYRAYFALDALARLAIFLGSLGTLLSSAENRQRLLLVSLSAMVLAAGTIVDFTTRLRPLSPDVVFAVQMLDAACALLFVIGLFIALTKQRMFDVVYAFSSGAVGAITFLAILAVVISMQQVGSAAVALSIAVGLVLLRIVYLCRDGLSLRALRQAAAYAIALILCSAVFAGEEGLLHWKMQVAGFDDWLARLLPGVPVNRELLGDIAVAGIAALALSPLEETLKERLNARLLPDEEKRFELLRHFRKGIAFFTEAVELERMLVNVVTTNLHAEFAHLFLHGSGRCYEPAASYPESLQRPPEVSLETLPPEVRCGKCRTTDLPCGCVPQARIVPALFAPARGQVFGFIALGPKRSDHGEDYTHREKQELHALGREAGPALYHLRSRV